MGSSRVQVKCPSCGTIFLPSIEETQSRAGASARRKGHAFERKIAKLLQDWWNINKEQKCEMYRTPMSGGSILKKGFNLAGDICSNASDFKFHCELKNAPSSYSGLHQFFSSKKFKFWDWLTQARNDCPLNKCVLLIVNRFDQPTWCMSPCIQKVGDIYINILDKLSCSNINYMVYYGHEEKVVIWSFDDMLTTNAELWK